MFLFLGVKTPKGAQEKNWKYLVRLDLVPGLDSVMDILKDNLKTHSFNLTHNKLRNQLKKKIFEEKISSTY